MKLAITYSELQDYVASHFKKTVNLGYVDGATVSVSVPIKVFGFTKSVSINIIVKKIEGADLFLSYDGKMGIDLLVSPAISYVKKLVPEKAETTIEYGKQHFLSAFRWQGLCQRRHIR